MLADAHLQQAHEGIVLVACDAVGLSMSSYSILVPSVVFFVQVHAGVGGTDERAGGFGLAALCQAVAYGHVKGVAGHVAAGPETAVLPGAGGRWRWRAAARKRMRNSSPP